MQNIFISRHVIRCTSVDDPNIKDSRSETRYMIA